MFVKNTKLALDFNFNIFLLLSSCFTGFLKYITIYFYLINSVITNIFYEEKLNAINRWF
jgi:hypothetical protein